MANSEERMKILKMIEEGKISAEEGAKLLTSLSDGRRGPGSTSAARTAGAGHLLRIRVTDIASGRSKASVQIPVGLIEAGMKIGAQFVPKVDGVDISAVMDAIRAGITGRIIDVDDDKEGEHIEIFVDKDALK
jgi:hypothetical protein